MFKMENKASETAMILDKCLTTLYLIWKMETIVLLSWVIIIMKWDKALCSLKSSEKQMPRQDYMCNQFIGRNVLKEKGGEARKGERVFRSQCRSDIYTGEREGRKAF